MNLISHMIQLENEVNHLNIYSTGNNQSKNSKTYTTTKLQLPTKNETNED